MKDVYAQIIIDISVKSLEKVFTYGIPESMTASVVPGALVEIPFGNGNRLMKGYVVGVVDQIEFDPSKLKFIRRVFEEISFEKDLVSLALWMKERYACTLATAFGVLLPPKVDMKKKQIRYVRSLLDAKAIESEIQRLSGDKRGAARTRVLETLWHTPYISQNDLLDRTGVSPSVIGTLSKQGLVEVVNERSYRMPYEVDDYDVTENLAANDGQKNAINAVSGALGTSEVFLLHGVTGSGKTEVYMQIIEKVLAKGQSAIVLIPEIGLTPQTMGRFVERFGDVVGIMHSRLSDGERIDQWHMAREGKIRIMIGPRSAVFAPFEKLGVIIIDEEHELTYKSEMPPKYHAREVAVYRGYQHQCPLVLGSATPLVESAYKAYSDAYTLLDLPDKAASSNPLHVVTLDMRKELADGNKSIFSGYLQEAMRETLARGEQIILFLNRRGYAKFVSCRKCGHVIKCDHCDVPYNYHKYRHQLLCHYCGKSQPMVTSCPNCGSQHIREFGVGTQKVEDMIAETFPGSRVLRMDYDTTSGKHGHSQVLNAFGNHEADILLGTQMVAKGHHFDNVTLVGVLAADMSLYTNDFRASERTFQLLTQVIGRSGRGDKPGQAVIQTYSPDHFSVVSAAAQDYDGFYRNEIAYRELMGYAPFQHMLLVLLTSKEEKYIIRLSYKVRERLSPYERDGQIEVLGPTPATLSKLNDTYRRVIYIKSKNYKVLTQLTERIYQMVQEEDRQKKASVSTDINPMMAY